MKSKIIIVVLAVVLLCSAISVSAMTEEERQALIAQIQAQITQLQQQSARMIQEQASGTASSWCHTFVRTLIIGDSGEEVGDLNIALIKEGLLPVTNTGGFENVSTDFSEETASAVVAFQERYASEILAPVGLIYGTGRVGPTTRAKLNALYGCTAIPTPTPTLTCNPNWQCTNWSYCANNQQTKTCADLNSCGVTTGRPPLTQSCGAGCTPNCVGKACSGADNGCGGRCTGDYCAFKCSLISGQWYRMIFDTSSNLFTPLDLCQFGCELGKCRIASSRFNDSSRWAQVSSKNVAFGETMQGSGETFPAAETFEAVGAAGNISNSDSGLTSSGKWKLRGDFDIQVSYWQNVQLRNLRPQNSNSPFLFTYLNPNLSASNFSPTAALVVSGSNHSYYMMNSLGFIRYDIVSWSDQPGWYKLQKADSNDGKGNFRIQRTGSIIKGYLLDGVGRWIEYASVSNGDTGDMDITLKVYNNITGDAMGVIPAAFFNYFDINSGTVIDNSINNVCTPSWQCTNWTVCASGQQTRTCADSNNCGVTTNKPATTQSCAGGSLSLVSSSAPASTAINSAFQIKCNFGYSLLGCVQAKHGNNNCVYSGYIGNDSIWNCTAATAGTINNYCNTFAYTGDPRVICAAQTIPIGSTIVSASPACVPNWNCAPWTACASGQQTKTCTDLNSCGVTTGRPSLTQSCTTQPSITVTSPNGGENVTRSITSNSASGYGVRWSISGLASLTNYRVNVYLMKAGTVLGKISSDNYFAGNSVANWGYLGNGRYIDSTGVAITAPVGNDYKIKAELFDINSPTALAIDTSDGYFSLVAAPVTTPTPTCTPNWQCTNWTACASGQQTRTCADSNSCGVLTGRPPLTQSCISLAQQSITVISPNGGEQWAQGTTQNITWTSTGVNTVYISFVGYSSTGVQANRESIATAVPASAGTYAWSIPAAFISGHPNAARLKVIVSSVAGGLPTSPSTDISDNYFSIVASTTGISRQDQIASIYQALLNILAQLSLMLQ